MHRTVSRAFTPEPGHPCRTARVRSGHFGGHSTAGVRGAGHVERQRTVGYQEASLFEGRWTVGVRGARR